MGYKRGDKSEIYKGTKKRQYKWLIKIYKGIAIILSEKLKGQINKILMLKNWLEQFNVNKQSIINKASMIFWNSKNLS